MIEDIDYLGREWGKWMRYQPNGRSSKNHITKLKKISFARRHHDKNEVGPKHYLMAFRQVLACPVKAERVFWHESFYKNCRAVKSKIIYPSARWVLA